MQSVTSTTQISSLPTRDATHSYRRGAVNRDKAVYSFHLVRRKCLNITRLSGGGKAATQPPDILFDRLVISQGKKFEYLEVSNATARKI